MSHTMVVIVNETLARQFWNGDALGKRITYQKQPVEVVGVVRDSKYWTLGGRSRRRSTSRSARERPRA
jgi:uncharacterized ParB-like nuclease family protein